MVGTMKKYEHMFKIIKFSFILLVPPLMLGGCGAVGALVDFAVESAIEARSGEDTEKDLKIKKDIKLGISDKSGLTKIVTISVDVYEQRVMLTGWVDTVEQIESAGSIAADTEGVKEVYNELTLDPFAKADMTEEEAKETGTEFGVSLLVDSAMERGASINELNWRWRLVNHTIFLLGRSFSDFETQAVRNVMLSVTDVHKVVNHAYTKGF
jgi:osmotically-inducible protein OsmY